VTVSKSIKKLTGTHVRYEPLGGVKVKGREESVQAFQVIDVPDAPPVFRTQGRGAEPLIGRGTDLEFLRECFASGRAHFVLLEGEAGVGKSRLLWEFRKELVDQHPVIAGGIGRCREGVPASLEPFSQLLHARAGAGLGDADAAERISRQVANDLGTFSLDEISRVNYSHLITLSLGLDLSDSRVKHIEARHIQEETDHAWLNWCKAVSSKEHFVITIEDLHWADARTLALLEHLAVFMDHERMLVLASKRPQGSAPRGFQVRALGSLDKNGCTEMAEGIFLRAVSNSLGDFLHEETGGNPYYVEELSRYLTDKNLVEGNPFRLRTAETKVPDTLNGLLVGRIDALSFEEKEVVTAASVIGRLFWIGVLECAIERQVHQEIARLRDLDMVFERPESELQGDVQFAFKHALLRDAAYSLLTRKDKAILHAAIATKLKGYSGVRAKALAAFHYDVAGLATESSQMYREAAILAERTSDYGQASEYYQRAIRLMPDQVSPDATLDIRFGVVSNRIRSGSCEGAEEELQKCLAAASSAGDKTLLARIYVFLGELHSNGGRLALAEEELKSALSLCRETGDEILKAKALIRLGVVQWRKFDVTLADETIEEALDVAESAGDMDSKAKAFAAKGLVTHYSGRYEESRSLFQQVLEIAKSIGSRHMISTALNNLGEVARAEGDCGAAGRCYSEALKVSREIGHPNGIAASLTNLAFNALALGQLDVARTNALESIRLGVQSHYNVVVRFNLIAIADVLFQEGRLDRSAEIVGALLHDPANEAETKSYLDALVARLERAVGKEGVQSGLERGKGLDVETLASDFVRNGDL
jgi:tetratricopeptide (TPR) repeat protein